MSKVWIKYSKKTSRSPIEKNHYVYFDKEFVENKEGVDEYCLDWANSIPGGENYGFEYDWEVVKYPPLDWLFREGERTAGKIKYFIEKEKFIAKTIDEIKYSEYREVKNILDEKFGEDTTDGAIWQWPQISQVVKQRLLIPEEIIFTQGAYLLNERQKLTYCFNDDFELVGTSDEKIFTPMTIKDFRENG